MGPREPNLANLSSTERAALRVFASQGMARVGSIQRETNVQDVTKIKELLYLLSERGLLDSSQFASVSLDELPWITVTVRTDMLPKINRALSATSSSSSSSNAPESDAS